MDVSQKLQWVIGKRPWKFNSFIVIYSNIQSYTVTENFEEEMMADGCYLKHVTNTSMNY